MNFPTGSKLLLLWCLIVICGAAALGIYLSNHPAGQNAASEITTNGTVAFRLDGHQFFTSGEFAAARHATKCACGWVEKMKARGGWGTTNGGPFPVYPQSVLTNPLSVPMVLTASSNPPPLSDMVGRAATNLYRQGFFDGMAMGGNRLHGRTLTNGMHRWYFELGMAEMVKEWESSTNGVGR